MRVFAIPYSNGGWKIIFPSMWHIVFSHQFVEDFEGHYEALIPRYMRLTYHDYDRDCYHWYHWSIAPFVRFYHVTSRPATRVLASILEVVEGTIGAFLQDRDHLVRRRRDGTSWYMSRLQSVRRAVREGNL